MTVFGEIRDHEFGAPDASHDLVGDLVVVLLSIDPKRFEPAISFDGRKNTNVVASVLAPTKALTSISR